MPAFPVDSDNAWAVWQAGRISATNLPVDVALPKYDSRPMSDQRPVLRNLATKAGHNAIRIPFDLWPLAEGDDALHEVDVVASKGWGDTDTTRKTAIHSWVDPDLGTIKALAEHIDRVLDQCAQLGLGVILCVGRYHADKYGALWRQLERHHRLVAFWERTAQRWPQHKALIGFELLNEPAPGYEIHQGQERGMFHSDMRRPPANGLPESELNYNPEHYTRLMERCISAIRRHNTRTPIIVSAIHGGNPDGLDIFRVKTAPDLDRELHNTPWPRSWSPLRPALVHGLNPYYGQDRTDGWSATDRSGLPRDPSGLVVYTFHCYLPAAFALQGVDSFAYHSTGVLYPKGDAPGETLQADETAWRDGLIQIRRADYSQGLAQMIKSCQRAVAFRRDFGVPVFVGEFSATNLDFIRSLPDGMATPLRGEHVAARQIVGLSWKDGIATAVLKFPLNLGVDNFVDAAGRPYSALPVVMDVQLHGGRSSVYNVREVPVILNGVRYEANAPTRFHRSSNNRFSFPLPGKAIEPIGLPADASPEAASQAPAIASFRIVITPQLAQRHQASRVEYVRDVLRMCQQSGFSWGWFSDSLTPARPDFGADMFRVDPQGRIRALLRRAAAGSVE